MARATLLFVGGLLALLAALAFKHVLIAPPPIPEQAEAGEFDTNRAFARLERVLADQQPHSVDSPGSDGVRERLLAEMRAVGLEPRVSDAMTCNAFSRNRSVNCARVRNLAATIGPAEGEHLLLVAHYDSTPVGPGAADAGIGVATLLEIAEQLRGRQLQRPVTFLFNEGEESGLLGARAFLDSDPAAPRVTTLVNLEARGVEGPAIMFETSRPNAAAIGLYGGAVERPVANSLSTDFYRLLPNSTDVAVFEERPWTILNLAIIGNETRYHSAGDDLAALDRRSLGHMGGQALQVTLAHTDGVEPAAPGELLYADVLGRHLITLPLSAGLALLGLIVVAFGYAVFRRGAWGRPLLAGLAAAMLAAIAALVLTLIVQQLRPGEFWRAFPIAMQVAVAGTALLAMALCLGIAGSKSKEQVRVAAWLLITLAGGAICFIAPGAAIYFLCAPLILLAGVLAERWRAGTEKIAGWVAALVQLLTLLPVMALVDLLLSTSPGWIAAPLAVLAALPLVIELRPDVDPGRGSTLVTAGVMVAAWAAVLLVPAYSADRQEIFTVEHLRDRNTGTAKWGIYSDGAALPEAYNQLGPWERGAAPYARRPRWIADAPNHDGPAPELVRVAERPAASGRLVTLRLTLNGWDGAVVQIPASAGLRSLSTDGAERAFGAGESDYTIRCTGRACHGFTFDLLVGSAEPVDATVIGNVARLPDFAAPLIAARPENARPQYVPDASYALTPARF
jgi:hypothetical protein